MVISEQDKAIIEACVNEKGWRDKFSGDELKEKIRSAWDEISLDEIRNCISSWKKRLRLVCSEDGGHIEHLLK